MNLQLRHLIEAVPDDLSLLRRWMHDEQVRQSWGDPEENLRQLSQAPEAGHWRAIIEADGHPIGLVLWQHPTRQELDLAGLTDIPTSAIDIDIMIGEPDAMGCGLGPVAIMQVADIALIDPAVPFLIACASLDNQPCQHAFAKAGFRRDREFDDVPLGRHVLMVRPRHET